MALGAVSLQLPVQLSFLGRSPHHNTNTSKSALLTLYCDMSNGTEDYTNTALSERIRVRDLDGHTFEVGPPRKHRKVVHQNEKLVDFPSREEVDSAEQYVFFSPDLNRPLCQKCTSIKFADLISIEGALHSTVHESEYMEEQSYKGCPMCTRIWAGLVQDVQIKCFGFPRKDKEQRPAASRQKPLLLFLNPLCPDKRGIDYGILPYQLCELSAWSSSQEQLHTTNLENWHRDEYSYWMPSLETGMNALSNEFAPIRPLELDRGQNVATASFMLKTSWCE
jgi:hypothetical protein